MKKRLTIFIMIILVSLPILLIIYISWKEAEKYKVDDYFTVQEKSFGDAREVIIGDIEETIQLKGTVTSLDFDFYYIFDQEADIYVSEQQEVFVGSYLAIENGFPIQATSNGIIESIIQTEYGYKLKVRSFKNLLARLEVAGDTDIKVGKTYTDTRGVKFICAYKSNQIQNGKTVYYFKFEEKYMYAQSVQINLKTAKKETDILMVEKEAIFTDLNDQAFIRLIDENDNVIGDQKVTVGISDGTMIAITGVKKGSLYDVEYAKYMNQINARVKEDENNTENTKSE